MCIRDRYWAKYGGRMLGREASLVRVWVRTSTHRAAAGRLGTAGQSVSAGVVGSTQVGMVVTFALAHIGAVASRSVSPSAAFCPARDVSDEEVFGSLVQLAELLAHCWARASTSASAPFC